MAEEIVTPIPKEFFVWAASQGYDIQRSAGGSLRDLNLYSVYDGWCAGRQSIIKPIDTAPRDGTPMFVMKTVRYEPYKPDGVRQMGKSGRWQEWNGYGWDNCKEDPEEWVDYGNKKS